MGQQDSKVDASKDQCELDQEEFDYLERSTNLSPNDLSQLYGTFMDADSKTSHNMTIDQFKTEFSKFYPGGDGAAFVDHVFQSLRIDDGNVDFYQFIYALQLICKGAKEQQLRCASSLHGDTSDGCSVVDCTQETSVTDTQGVLADTDTIYSQSFDPEVQSQNEDVLQQCCVGSSSKNYGFQEHLKKDA